MARPTPPHPPRRSHLPTHELAVVGDDPELEMASARHADALASAVTTGVRPADRCSALPPEQAPHLILEGVGEVLGLPPATA